MKLCALLFAPLCLEAAGPKLTPEDRIEIIRGLNAEYAITKIELPSSKKALPISATGVLEKQAWEAASRGYIVAAKKGDTVQITKVIIQGDEIQMEINGGLKSGVKWTDRISIGMGGGDNQGQGQQSGRGSGVPTTGTTMTIKFPGGVPSIETKDLKKILAGVLDFEKHSATENYLDTLPAPVLEAIKQNRVIEGMNKEQVILAVGRPRLKHREVKDGVEEETWIYGVTGKVSFITYHGDKVVKVKDEYASLGGTTAAPLPVN
jgi:hypothetical protein